MLNYTEAADAHNKAFEAHAKTPNDYTKKELDRAQNNLAQSFGEIREFNIFDYFYSLYSSVVIMNTWIL